MHTPARTRLAQAAAIFCLLFGLELVLSGALPASALRVAELPLLARLGAFGVDVVTAGIVVMAGLAIATWGTRGRTLRLMLLLATFALATLYVTSWGMFGVVPQFLDRKGFAFWWVQPVQLFYWAEPAVVASLAAAAVALAWLVARWLPQRVARSGAATQRAWIVVACSLAVAAVGSAMLAELTSEP
jgi:hypothetical protein